MNELSEKNIRISYGGKKKRMSYCTSIPHSDRKRGRNREKMRENNNECKLEF